PFKPQPLGTMQTYETQSISVSVGLFCDFYIRRQKTYRGKLPQAVDELPVSFGKSQKMAVYGRMGTWRDWTTIAFSCVDLRTERDYARNFGAASRLQHQAKAMGKYGAEQFFNDRFGRSDF